METNSNEPLDCLPLIPEATLKRHHCYQRFDTRFRAGARLLSALWREERGLPIGSYQGEDGKRHKLGSRISDSAARCGANFYSAEIARAVHRELIYREYGAMVDENRLWSNLLSSQPLCFSALIGLKLELTRATSALHELIPGFAGTVTHVLFEHSPGRGSPRFLGDYTAFDALFRYITPEGRRGFVAVEMKYSEGHPPIPQLRPRYDEVSEQCGLYRDPSDPALRSSSLNQLWREHMISELMVREGLFEEGFFLLISPALNHHVQQAAASYRALLEPAEAQKVRFLDITLENLIEVIRLCDPDHAAALHRRYCDWGRLDRELELNLPNFGPFVRKPERRNAEDAIEPSASITVDASAKLAGNDELARERPKKPRRARSQETA